MILWFGINKPNLSTPTPLSAVWCDTVVWYRVGGAILVWLTSILHPNHVVCSVWCYTVVWYTVGGVWLTSVPHVVRSVWCYTVVWYTVGGAISVWFTYVPHPNHVVRSVWCDTVVWYMVGGAILVWPTSILHWSYSTFIICEGFDAKAVLFTIKLPTTSCLHAYTCCEVLITTFQTQCNNYNEHLDIQLTRHGMQQCRHGMKPINYRHNITLITTTM